MGAGILRVVLQKYLETKRDKVLFVYVLIAVLWALLTSGMIWGWSSLLIVLESEGVYSELCNDNGSNHDNRSQIIVCDKQTERLNLIFAFGNISALLSSIFVGLFLDRFGEKKLCMVGSSLVAIGCILFGSANLTGVDLYIPSFIFLGVGAPSIFYSLITLGKFFPKILSTLMSVFNCAFDASVIVFTIFKSIHDQSGAKIGVIFLAYTSGKKSRFVTGSVPVAIIIYSFFWPKEEKIDIATELDEQKLTEEVQDDRFSIEEETKDFQFDDGLPLEKRPDDLSIRDISSFSVLKQLRTWEFAAVTFYAMVSMLWMNFYIGNIELQLKMKINEQEGIYLAGVFSIILPLGIFAIPLVGWLLDKKGFLISFTLLSTVQVIHAIFNVFSIAGLHIFNFILYTFARALLYSALMSYAIKVYHNPFFKLMIQVRLQDFWAGVWFVTIVQWTFWLIAIWSAVHYTEHTERQILRREFDTGFLLGTSVLLSCVSLDGAQKANGLLQTPANTRPNTSIAFENIDSQNLIITGFIKYPIVCPINLHLLTVGE